MEWQYLLRGEIEGVCCIYCRNAALYSSVDPEGAFPEPVASEIVAVSECALDVVEPYEL